MSGISSYLFAFAWGLLILAALVGWGGVLGRFLFPTEHTDWGLRAAWGLALTVVVGGVLNLGSWISRTTVLVYLGSGIVCWLVASLDSIRRIGSLRASFQRMTSKSKPAIVFVVLTVMFLAGLRYAASVSVVRSDDSTGPAGLNRFSPIDDFQAYFAFPVKMLETGSMGRDPFCARRLQSSLGGQSFLDTFILSTLSVEHLRLIDSGVGLLLIVGLLCGSFQEKGTLLLWVLPPLLLFLLMGPWNNLTSFYTGTALFLALWRTLGWEPFLTGRSLSRILIIALIAAAICSLKSSFIPACGVLLAASFLFYLGKRSFRRDALLELISTSVLVLAFALPWMISMYQSSGTLLYPLLGRGYDQSVYKASSSPYSGLSVSIGTRLLVHSLKSAIFVSLIALGVLHLMSRQRGVSAREPVLSLLLAAAFGQVIITLATGGTASYRYGFPFMLAAILALMTEACSSPRELRRPAKLRTVIPLIASAIALFLLGSQWASSWALYKDCLQTVRLGLGEATLVSRPETTAYESLQRAVPPGAVILANLDKPFLLDFKRNPVLLLDYAEASPPPGIPLFKGSEQLARYLRSQSIRYVAYSYGDRPDHHRLSGDLVRQAGLWGAIALQQTYDFQDNLAELGTATRLIYDDGRNFVLDLQRAPIGETTHEPTNSAVGSQALQRVRNLLRSAWSVF